MKRIHVLGLIAAYLVFGCDPPPPDAVPPLESRVELTAGDVWLIGDGEKERLITGVMLKKDSVLKVGEGSRALIRLSTGTRAFLKGGTDVELVDGGVKMGVGELWADVTGEGDDLRRFSVGDVTVTASGAGFDLRVDGDLVTVYVARGLAVVASKGGRVEVQSGQRAVSKAGATPTVEPVAFWDDWTGGMADKMLGSGSGGKGTGRIYGIDRQRPGKAPQDLQIVSQKVKILIRDGLAHTTVDQRFFNPSSTPLEGWYWFTVPQGAAVERFALEVNGQLVDGEMTERKQAAAAYEEAVRKAFDPALLEWVDGRTFRARIFPIPAVGERRVVLSYTELLPLDGDVYRYVYPMGGDEEVEIQEFSLEVDLGDEGEDYEIATLQDARIEEDRSLISMRRSGYVPRSDFLLELKRTQEVEPLKVMRFETGEEEADYVMIRYSPEVEWEKIKEVPGDVVVVLDTSAGGDESDRQVRADAVEAVLRALSSTDRFAVIAADLKPRIVYPAKGLAPASEEEVSAAIEGLAEIVSAGATDLGAMFNTALKLVHESEQPAVVYIGDGRATVGETTHDELAERLRRSMGDSRARLFTIAVGDDANYSLLDRLARVGGGKAFRIDVPDQTVQEALRFAGSVKTPTITNLHIDAGAGLDQVFSIVSGKISEGQEMIMLARTHHALPDEIKVTGRLEGKPFERKYEVSEEEGEEYGYIPGMWGRLYLERLMGEGLEESRGTIISLGLNYALMTPFTSFLVLESDAAYEAQGIERRSRLRSWTGRNDGDDGVDLADLTVGALGFPLSLTGCLSEGSEDEKNSVEQTREEMSDRFAKYVINGNGEEQGGKGKRHKGEEGQMGKRDATKSANQYGMRGPSGNPNPSMARERAVDQAQTDGILGSLSAKGGQAGEGTIGLGNLNTIGRGGGGGTGTGYGRGAGSLGGRRSDEVVKESESKAAPAAVVQIAVGNPYETSVRRSPFKKEVCSDASKRPLRQRRILWSRRLSRASGPDQMARIFFEAGKRCELDMWRDRRVLLDMLENRVGTPEDVRGLLVAFSGYPAFQRYLRRKILRRSLDTEMVYNLYFSEGVNWSAVQRGLAAMKTDEDRLKKVRELLEEYPDDPVGRSLLAQTLLDAGENEEALAVAYRLRRDGLAGPSVLRIMCDLQAEAGFEEEAQRSCSELVEFNPDDPAAREQLGNLFLRHGWYEAAYRQFKTLVEVAKENPLAMLRLASAAAGMGKIDEALRLERKVASSQGEPGPSDPRLWARLHSAARLAKMIIEARKGKDASKTKALERGLKRTQVFTGKSTLKILVWSDVEAQLSLAAVQGKDPYPVSADVPAYQTGLYMIDMGLTVPSDVDLSVNLKGAPLRRAVPFNVYTISFDGKKFAIEDRAGELAPRETEMVLEEV